MRRVQAQRVIRAFRQGSSWPVMVETESGRFVAKLRGVPQGVGVLIAELIASELAQIFQLPVPECVLVQVPEQVPSLDRNDELRDLLEKSAGLNIGFRYLEGAAPWDPAEVESVDPSFAATVLVLDNLVMNLDRTASNPNLLVYREGIWLVDHGASLPFSHWWSQVEEGSPREGFPLETHVFWGFRHEARQLAPLLLGALDRSVLEGVLQRIPDEMLLEAPLETTPIRTRAAYVAFLLKRVRALQNW